MPLTVTAISYRGSPPMGRVAAVFTSRGGTLGRAPDNDLVLPDPEKIISRAHAAIRYQNGAFYLTDTSLAGTAIANRGISLNQSTAQESTRLEDGDIIKVGDYELAVAIAEKEATPPPPPRPDSPPRPTRPDLFPAVVTVRTTSISNGSFPPEKPLSPMSMDSPAISSQGNPTPGASCMPRHSRKASPRRKWPLLLGRKAYPPVSIHMIC